MQYRCIGFDAKMVADLNREVHGRCLFSLHHKYPFEGVAIGANKIKQLRIIGVCGKSLNFSNLGSHRNFLAKHLHNLRAINEPPAE